MLFEDSSKSTIHPFGALGIRTNVMSEILVAGLFLLFFFPPLISLSWGLNAKSPPADFLLAGDPF